MDLGKKALLLSGLLAAFCCRGANYTDLADDDAGQLVFRKRDSAVFVFRKRAEGRWEVAAFKGNAVVKLRPSSCVLLDFAEEELTPGAVAASLVYWRSCADAVETARAYRFLAERINSTVTGSLLAYLEKEEQVVRELARLRSSYLSEMAKSASKSRKGGVSAEELVAEKFAMLVENNPCRTAIEGLIQKGNDLFVATVLFLEYRARVLRLARELEPKLRQKVLRELDSLVPVLLKKFDQQRDLNKKREADFKAVCPGRHGKWEYASPVNLAGMRAKAESCFQALRRTWQTSPHSEFPVWGNAMLEVMQMIGSPELEKKFDDAYGVYQKRVKAPSSN